MGDRFLSVEVPGAQTPEELRELFRLKLYHAMQAGKYDLTEEELEHAVDYYMERKRSFQGNGVETASPLGLVQQLSGRAVADICEAFTSFDDDAYLRNLHRIKQAPASNKRTLLYELMPTVTVQRLVQGIDDYVDSIAAKARVQDAYRNQGG